MSGVLGVLLGDNASAAANVTFTQTAHSGQFVNSTSGTFGGVDIGTASADRVVVIVVCATADVVTSVTVGGISATKAVEENTIISACHQIWYASVPTGATASVVVNSASNMGDCSIVAGALTGATATPTATNSAANGAADPANITITVPASGVAIACIDTGGTTVGTWSSATLDTSFQGNGTGIISLAHTSTAGSQTPSYSGLAGDHSHTVAAAWGP